MAIGASLWGLFNQTGEFGSAITKPGTIGCQYGYVNLRWFPGSPVFDQARARACTVTDWQNVILVNMLGKRFYDETGRQFTANNYNERRSLRARAAISTPRTSNTIRTISSTRRWPASATAITAAARSGRSSMPTPSRARNGTRSRRTSTSTPASSSAPTRIDELAAKIVMKYQRVPMPPQNLEATVARYNSFVDAGKDADFGKPTPLYKIAKPPFYAAWATPVIHDTRAGLRINARCQVIDMNGEVIPGLYCGGESAGGFSQHGLPRATCQGYIAGKQCRRGEPRGLTIDRFAPRGRGEDLLSGINS